MHPSTTQLLRQQLFFSVHFQKKQQHLIKTAQSFINKVEGKDQKTKPKTILKTRSEAKPAVKKKGEVSKSYDLARLVWNNYFAEDSCCSGLRKTILEMCPE